MQQLRILYLDRDKDKALFRALSKHGVVFHAKGLNQALFLMADSDFDYYFIDADIPQSQAFLKHVRHDPELAPPQGVVLLTNNDEEDCEAWHVDDFLTRRTATSDLPYIFSHLKAEKLEPPRILRLAETPPDIEQEEAPPEGSVGAEDHEIEDIRSHLRARKDTDEVRRGDSVMVSFNDAAVRKSPAKLVIAAVALISLIAWLFLWGPLASKQAKVKAPDAKRKTVDAEATRTQQIEKYKQTTLSSPSSAPAAAVTSSQPSSPSGKTEADAAAPVLPVENQKTTATPAPEPPPAPAPAPQPVNHPPNVSISGPGQVMRGQSATFSADASDPDDDPVSLSWSPGQTVYSDTVGSITVTVTATDSHGESSSASATVEFI